MEAMPPALRPLSRMKKSRFNSELVPQSSETSNRVERDGKASDVNSHERMEARPRKGTGTIGNNNEDQGEQECAVTMAGLGVAYDGPRELEKQRSREDHSHAQMVVEMASASFEPCHEPQYRINL